MSKSAAKTPKDFEEAMAELEQIVADMEAGRITLEESLVRFERGTFLIDHCRKVLSAAEKKIEQLTKPADASAGDSPESPTDDRGDAE